MDGDSQQALVKQIGQLLLDHNIDADVEIYRESVCALGGNEVQEKRTLMVNKDLPSSDADKADAFNAALKDVTKGVEGLDINVVSKLGAGDKYKTITDVVALNETDKMNLEHKEGEVWLLDFWATWCPPCQKPMAHNVEMLEKRGAEWGSDVRIIGLSIDQSMEKLAGHVKSKNWTSVEHYHRAGSDASKVYSVSGVPHVMLIDKTGTIVFKGHPAKRPNLEDDLDKLRNGECLTGDGVFSGEKKEEAGEKKEEKKDDGFKEVDAAAINQEIDGFKAVAEGLQADAEIKELAKKCPRAFCVMTFTQKYNPTNETTLGDYKNYRVLVGPQASIDSLKSSLEGKVEGSFEVVLQQHAI